MKGILGRKLGMTQVFLTDGKLVPVTVVEVLDNTVTQIKTKETDGYDAIQLGAFNKREKISNKPEMGHVKKANTEPKRFFSEIRGIETSSYEVGQVIGVDTFVPGEIVDVTGTSKGKGFQGVIKRWNFACGPMAHGSRFHRRPGSRGPMLPMRVLKGKKLPGHMGNETVTLQNLEIVSIDTDNSCLLISGNVPGPKNGFVLIRTAVKGRDNKTAKELVSYSVEEIEDTEIQTNEVEEEVVIPSIEETVQESENKEATEEIVQEETVETPETKEEN